MLLERSCIKSPHLARLRGAAGGPACLRVRLEIAVQVAATFRVDPFDVHAAWGMSYLQCGLLDKARAKFEKCFTSVSVSEVLQGEPHHEV